MNKEELKKNIVDILVNCKSDECAIEYCSECDGNPCIENCREKQQADALIAAGIGDVKEAGRRAEVAEKAGRIIQRDMARVFDISNPRVCELIANIWDLAKKQAEKELAEERKDD